MLAAMLSLVHLQNRLRQCIAIEVKHDVCTENYRGLVRLGLSKFGYFLRRRDEEVLAYLPRNADLDLLNLVGSVDLPQCDE